MDWVISRNKELQQAEEKRRVGGGVVCTVL